MNKDELIKYIKKAPYRILIENIAFGKNDGMSFRYELSKQELYRRNNKIPLILSIFSIIVAFMSVIISIVK